MKPRNKLPRRLVILYQMPESWLNVHSIWEAASADPAWEVRVVVLPFLHKDYDWKREKSKDHLDGLGVAHEFWDAFDLRAAAGAVFLFTSPYDSTRPPEYHFENIRQLAGATAYVPYGLETGGGEINHLYQYGQPIAKGASAIFVRGADAREMYARHCPTGAGHVLVTGLPRMDGFAGLDRFPVDPGLRQQIGDRKAVLWNAHFSFDADLWSTFDLLGEGIFDAFESRPDLALLFRPHPLLWKQLTNMGILDEAGVRAFKRELEEKGVVVDERPDHRHAFAASAAMLSDVGSFLLEYLVTGKPVLYLENRDGLGVNEVGESLISFYDKASDMSAVRDFLDRVSSGDDPGRQRRISAIDGFFPQLDGKAGQRALRHLGSLVR